MNIIAIRGATTVLENTKSQILEATEELLSKIINENEIEKDKITSILFTATKDITKVYPAVAARQLGITEAALMCMQEMYVEASLPLCIRIMLQAQGPLKQKEVSHIYLRKATGLRPDLAKKRAIAIDGPAGAGKSTIAKNIAASLGYIYIDTGAMYRAVAYYCKQKEVDWYNELEVSKILDEIHIQIKIIEDSQHIYLNNKDITSLIRTQDIGGGASAVATYNLVRKKLVQLQKDLAKGESVVMDGRDIGTHVLKDASVKIFLTASTDERAMRRFLELKEKGLEASLEEITKEIIDRDYNDINRDISPLCKADDAIEYDSTGKSIEEVTSDILKIIND